MISLQHYHHTSSTLPSLPHHLQNFVPGPIFSTLATALTQPFNFSTSIFLNTSIITSTSINTNTSALLPHLNKVYNYHNQSIFRHILSFITLVIITSSPSLRPLLSSHTSMLTPILDKVHHKQSIFTTTFIFTTFILATILHTGHSSFTLVVFNTLPISIQHYFYRTVSTSNSLDLLRMQSVSSLSTKRQYNPKWKRAIPFHTKKTVMYAPQLSMIA